MSEAVGESVREGSETGRGHQLALQVRQVFVREGSVLETLSAEGSTGSTR